MVAASKTTKAKKAVSKSPRTPKADKIKKPIQSKAKEQKVVGHLKTGLDVPLVEKAVEALLGYHEKQSEGSNALLGSDASIQVQITLLRAPQDSSPKPIRVMIPHPLYQLADKKDGDDVLEEPEICLIVKEDSKPECQKMIERFPEQLGCIKKVLGLQSLRNKHARYQQRRELLQKYNMFLADDRILPMLSKALGKEFFKAKKLPVPIKITRQEALPFAVQKALSATYMTISTGTCMMIRAGHTGMSADKLVENVVEIVKNAAPRIPRKWANIQNVAIKTPSSMSLPVYSKTPEVLREIAKLAGLVEDIEEAPYGEMDETRQDEDSSNKKKRDIKSPLLRALKKQKKEEKESKKNKSVDNKHKSQRKSLKGDEEKEKIEKPILEKAEKRKEKKRRTSSEGSIKESDKKGESAKKSKKSETRETESEEPKRTNFVAAKRFKGSKKGYVFKMGKEGLGYYVDVKPVVDRMMLEAIMRMKKNPRGRSKSPGGRRGGQKNNKYKGTRRF